MQRIYGNNFLKTAFWAKIHSVVKCSYKFRCIYGFIINIYHLSSDKFDRQNIFAAILCIHDYSPKR